MPGGPGSGVPLPPPGGKGSNMTDRPDSLETVLFGAPLIELRERCAGHAALRRCLRTVEEQHADPLELRAMAERCGLEPSYLNRLLRQAVGLTFHQLLIRRRLLAVARTLRQARANILHAALEHGFGSVRACQRAFLRILGTTPQDYQRRQRRRDSGF